nr:hypothetical protein Iba_chr11aCG2320 [Ipomoea batatas]
MCSKFATRAGNRADSHFLPKLSNLFSLQTLVDVSIFSLNSIAKLDEFSIEDFCSANKTDNLSVQSSNLLSANANSTESPKLRQSIRCFNSVSRDKVSSRIEKLSSDNKRMISWISLLLSKRKESGALHVSSMRRGDEVAEDSGREEERLEVARVESDPGGERERGGGRAVAEGGEFEVVAAAGGGEDGELVLEDEGATGDDVVDGEEALEGDGGVAGAVEAVHEGGDEGGGGGA